MTRDICIGPDFSQWRDRARELLEEGTSPDDIVWADASSKRGGLYETSESEFKSDSVRVRESEPIPVPRSFLRFAAAVACHSDPDRWSILYRLLWRVAKGGEKHLLLVSTDPDVRRASQLARAVQEDIQKMRSLLRFRKVGETESGREQFVSWYEPTYRIVRRNASYFQKQHSGMDWSLLTPDHCAHWDGEQLFFTKGLCREQAPDGEELEEIWRTAFQGLFLRA